MAEEENLNEFPSFEEIDKIKSQNKKEETEDNEEKESAPDFLPSPQKELRTPTKKQIIKIKKKSKLRFMKPSHAELKERKKRLREHILARSQEIKKKNLEVRETQLPSEKATLKLIDEREIAVNFASKVYEKFDKIVKSVILFGSQNKGTATATSDIDIIIIVDDASIQWDEELVAWYREELGKIIMRNPYRRSLHINSVRLTTWWNDMIHGDPVVINIIRYGDGIIDFGGFFNPLKILLETGKIRSTPEAIYIALQRAPSHLARSNSAKLASIEGLYWAMVDSAHALLMTAKQIPPSPEHIPIMLKDLFVDTKNLNMRYVIWYRDMYVLHRKIVHGEMRQINGSEIDDWQKKAEEFVKVMTETIKRMVE